MLPSRNPGTQLQAPPPGSPPAFQAPLPQSQASPQSRCRQACRNQAGRGPKGIYCRSVLRSQGHLALFTFWSIGCLHRTRRTRKLMANCKWPKAGTPKLRYRKPPRVGPMVRVSGCIEAQRPSMVPVGGRGVSQARAGSWGPPPRLPRSRAQRGLRCVPDPPRPGPAGRLPVATPVLRPQARRGLGTGASTGQALSSGAARELAMTSQRADAGEMGLAAKGPTGSRQ